LASSKDITCGFFPVVWQDANNKTISKKKAIKRSP